MIKYRINKKKVESLMAREKMNHTDLAVSLRVSKQRLHQILNGGKSYAPILANFFGCAANELVQVLRKEKD
jgi:plasmid maintenance system antidote protein VapI